LTLSNKNRFGLIFIFLTGVSLFLFLYSPPKPHAIIIDGYITKHVIKSIGPDVRMYSACLDYEYIFNAIQYQGRRCGVSGYSFSTYNDAMSYLNHTFPLGKIKISILPESPSTIYLPNEQGRFTQLEIIAKIAGILLEISSLHFLRKFLFNPKP
jgi:hypothetical protein